MPYDIRPLSEGGNRGIDEEFSRKASEGKFRIICVDTFDGTDWLGGDYKNLSDARKAKKSLSGELLKVHIYNDKGIHLT